MFVFQITQYYIRKQEIQSQIYIQSMILSRQLLKRTLNTCQNYGIRYSKDYLRSLDIDHAAIEQQRKKVQEQALKQKVFNNKANDNNQKNHIKVKLNHPLFDVHYRPQNDVQTCSIMVPQPIKPRKTISATRKYIITSIKKAKDAMHPVKRMYILDAIALLQNSHKKVAKLMVRTFWNLIDHAKQRGMKPMRLWVHGCLIGKTKRYHNIRYHAKGRGNRQKRDFCRVQVVLYEKEEEEFYQQIAQGKCASGLANAIRRTILDNPESDYKTLTRYSYITTAKGRQQASELLKRRIDLEMAENEKRGIFVPKKQIRKDLLAASVQKVREDLAALMQTGDSEQSLLKREELYKKNMGIID